MTPITTLLAYLRAQNLVLCRATDTAFPFDEERTVEVLEEAMAAVGIDDNKEAL